MGIAVGGAGASLTTVSWTEFCALASFDRSAQFQPEKNWGTETGLGRLVVLAAIAAADAGLKCQDGQPEGSTSMRGGVRTSEEQQSINQKAGARVRVSGSGRAGMPARWIQWGLMSMSIY